jgi:type III secretion protein U
MSGEKTEEPTEKKLEDARKKGQVAFSKDLAKLCSVVAVMEVALAAEPMCREAIFSLFEHGIMSIGKPFRPAMQDMVSSVWVFLFVNFCLFYLLCSVVGILAHWSQFGMLIATESLQPKFDSLNPVNGLKGLISKKKLVEILFSIGKTFLIVFLVYSQVRTELSAIINLATGVPQDVYFAFITLIKSCFHTIIVICLAMGMVDLIVQKQIHKKGLMMSMEDIKKESKESEGDPMIKGKRKEIAQELANSPPAAQTEKANAVVVNPTHFAVAMFYDREQPMVPMVLARGKDEVAQAMIARAREFNIPVIRHVWLARVLYASCKPGAPVPRSTYESVAHVYAVVYELFKTKEFDRTIELESHGIGPQE